MKNEIIAEPKEIAAPVPEIQERQANRSKLITDDGTEKQEKQYALKQTIISTLKNSRLTLKEAQELLMECSATIFQNFLTVKDPLKDPLRDALKDNAL